VTHLTAVFLYHHHEDGRSTGRNMLVKILIKVHHKIKVHVLLLDTFYKIKSYLYTSMIKGEGEGSGGKVPCLPHLPTSC
jgi:hypothetical protein